MKRKILYALLSFAIAFGLWAYVITVVSPESEATYYDVPVVLSNESVLNDKGLMIVSQTSPKVTLRLKGNRIDLNNLKHSDIILVADLAKINDPGEQKLNYTISYPGSFGYNAFEVLSYSSDRITLNIVERSTKELDIIVNPIGQPAGDYIIAEDGITQDISKITLTGPKSVIDKIAQARIDVDVTDVSQAMSVTEPVTLCDAEGQPVDASQVLVNVTEVNVSIRIHRVKTLQLLLDVIYGGGATEENTRIHQNYSTIKVAGSDLLLETLGDTLTIGTLDVSKIMGDTYSEVYAVTLPEGIRNLSGVEEVKATVTFPGMKTVKLELPVSRNMMFNIPEGLTIEEIGTLICEVTFRGPEELVEHLAEDDVMIRVDLTGAEVGEGLYGAQIQVIDPNLSAVGVVGIYNISVKLAATAVEPTA